VISLHGQWDNCFTHPCSRRMVVGIACFSEYLYNCWEAFLLNKDKAEEIAKRMVCDITKAKTLLGFEPRVLSRRGQINFEWYKKRKWL